MKSGHFLSVALFMMLASCCLAAPLRRDDRNAEAEALAVKFVAALVVEKNPEKASDLTATPFAKVERTRESVAVQWLTSDIQVRERLNRDSFSRIAWITDCGKATPYNEEARKVLAHLGDAFVKGFDDALGSDGRLVTVPARLDGHSVTVLVLVGWRGGRACVVGSWYFLERG